MLSEHNPEYETSPVEFEDLCDSVDLFLDRHAALSEAELAARLVSESFRYADN